MPDHDPAPHPSVDLSRVLAERDDARAEVELLRERLDHLEGQRRADPATVAKLIAERDEAEEEADRLHELLRHLHAGAASATQADLIALNVDVRRPRREVVDVR